MRPVEMANLLHLPLLACEERTLLNSGLVSSSLVTHFSYKMVPAFQPHPFLWKPKVWVLNQRIPKCGGRPISMLVARAASFKIHVPASTARPAKSEPLSVGPGTSILTCVPSACSLENDWSITFWPSRPDRISSRALCAQYLRNFRVCLWLLVSAATVFLPATAVSHPDVPSRVSTGLPVSTHLLFQSILHLVLYRNQSKLYSASSSGASYLKS